jgi:hypothetical protein
MSTDESKRAPFSLKRWSQRKLEATRAAPAPTRATPESTRATPEPPPAPREPLRPPTSRADSRESDLPTGADAGVARAPIGTGPREAGAPSVDAAPLPPVESLTIDSDFSSFLAPEVDEGLRRRALRQLFRDPHFNAMDGLDVYIDDYSTPDPISAETVRQLVQARYIFDPPKTRVNADGVVEDVPHDDVAAAGATPGPPLPGRDPGTEAGAEAVPMPASEARAPEAPKPATRDAAEAEPAAGSPPAPSEPAPR